ncbi:MAG TPA: LamG domain-containing protein, partial [Steroidobacteraceae bacterium]|nr:LamG domain-containing protein [Steroidobacteraceae bacterium]
MRKLHLIHIAAWCVLLAACSGGAKVAVNPDSAPPAVDDYAGPAPATADVQSFRVNFWQNVKANNRCGGCHNANGQVPRFARNDDVNQAYDAILPYVDLTEPDKSPLVAKVGGGHNCWLADAKSCADILTTWITKWAGGAGGGGTQIALQAPNDTEVGDSKAFPDSPALFESTVWALVRGNGKCLRCHAPDASPGPSQAPFFASADPNEAYAAAQAKINLDDPASSRFVVRLRNESHNCWTSSCANDANAMQAAIQAFADQVQPTPVDPALKVSRAVTILNADGSPAATVASGGNRFDTNVIARYEFKTGSGDVAYDTSGVDPELDLQFTGNVTWVGGWGVNIKSAGKAQGTTTASKKLFDRIKASGEYTIEAWIAPADVTQDNAWIVSYSGSETERNVTLAQRAFQYEALARSSTTGANGAPALVTLDTDRDAQASLQHVVLTFDPVNGRRLYVNGSFTGDLDPRPGGSLADWDSTYALVLGNETSGTRQWQGVVRFLAIHDRALTLAQIQQNFAAGVGERYFLLFDVSALTGMAQSYVMFEVSQYDNGSYLFNKPVFISLDASAMPGSIPIKGMRIGINGAEALVGQAYAKLDTTVSNANYSPGSGQLLSRVGTVIGLQRGPRFDQFFLSFDQIGSQTHTRTPETGVQSAPVDLPPASDIGVRTFEQLNQSMSRITGVPTTDSGVRSTYLQVQQQLPPVPDIQAFLASHQTGIAQLAIKYCAVMVDNATYRQAFFPSLNLGTAPATQFAGPGKDILLVPLLTKAFQQ